MKKGNTEFHANTWSSQREFNPSTSAPLREKKSGWQIKTFGDVLEIRNGRNQREVESADGEFPIYGSAGNVMGMATDYICEAGTTIIGRKGNINSPIYSDTRFWNVDTAFGLAVKAGMDSRFLYFFCLSYDFSAHNRGTTIPSLVKSELLNIPIPVPPLAEQQRIVGLLDEAFEGLATAKAIAKKNLQNASALFESHLQSVFTQRGPEWVETKLDDVTDLITCGVAKRPEYVPEGIPFLSAKNVKGGQVIWSGHQYVAEETHRALTKNNKPKIGDILYTRVGSYGEAAIIERDVEFSIFVSLTLIKAKPVVLNSFLKHYLNSSAVKELAADSITGSGVGNLNVGTVREFPIHLPPLAEQRSIVSKLDHLREQTQRLVRLYEQKLAALEALKKSLLHQAFTGDL